MDERYASADLICTEAQDVLSVGVKNVPAIWKPYINMKIGNAVPGYPRPFGIIHSCPGMDWRHVRAAVLGENGVAEGAKPGTVLIDMSSIDPTESKAIGEELKKFGIEMLDAPVSGGEPKAIDGTLSVMVGGKKELFDKYYEMLMVMAGSSVYVGELGSGNVAKLANQMVVAVNIAAISEALTFAKKAGTDPGLVYQAIRGGLAGSTVMDAKTPMMLERNFKPGFRIELHIKDLNNALNAAHGARFCGKNDCKSNTG